MTTSRITARRCPGMLVVGKHRRLPPIVSPSVFTLMGTPPNLSLFKYNRSRPMRTPIPDDVHRFVLTSVASVPFLEAMLLLRAHPSTAWSASELAQRLFVSTALGEELLAELSDAGLALPAEGAGIFRWNSGTAMGVVVDRLANLYAVNVVDVTELIHSRQERRARQFADAFRLRRKQD